MGKYQEVELITEYMMALGQGAESSTYLASIWI
jgi:hypothetical protein